MSSISITDQPTAIVPPARRRWIRIINVGSHPAFLLVDNPNVTAEEGTNAGLPLMPEQSLLLDGTLLNSIKEPFSIFAVAQAGESTTLRYQDYNPAMAPLLEGSILFNGFQLTYNSTPIII